MRLPDVRSAVRPLWAPGAGARFGVCAGRLPRGVEAFIAGGDAAGSLPMPRAAEEEGESPADVGTLSEVA